MDFSEADEDQLDELDDDTNFGVVLSHSTRTTLELNNDAYSIVIHGSTVDDGDVVDWHAAHEGDETTRDLSAGESTIIEVNSDSDLFTDGSTVDISLRHEASDSLLTTDEGELRNNEEE